HYMPIMEHSNLFIYRDKPVKAAPTFPGMKRAAFQAWPPLPQGDLRCCGTCLEIQRNDPENPAIPYVVRTSSVAWPDVRLGVVWRRTGAQAPRIFPSRKATLQPRALYPFPWLPLHQIRAL